MKAANGGPIRANHPNAEKLMINATFGKPLRAKYPRVKN